MSGERDETGVVESLRAWAYCNLCEWTGPNRPTVDSAEFDLSIHNDTPGHNAHRKATP